MTDPSHAAIPGATVTLTDTATKLSQATVTNDTGRYIFVGVNPGEYNITVSKESFRTVRMSAQSVKVGLALTMDLQMEIGSATQTIEVVAAGTELQTLNATIGNTVTAASLDALPSLNRDISTFVELQPGVSPDGSVAGAVVDQSTFMLDGGNNTNDMDGSMSVYTKSFAGDPAGGLANQSFAVAAGPTGVMPTPADSVEEFKVNTANQTADFNSSSGAQVEVVTRRGTDSHSTAASTSTTWTTISRQTPGTTMLQRPHCRTGTAAALGLELAAQSCRNFWAEKPTSSEITRAIAGPIPPPWSGRCPRQTCAWGCSLSAA